LKFAVRIGWYLLISFQVQLSAQNTFRQKLDSTVMLIGDQQQLSIYTDQATLGEKPFEILDTLHWFQILDKGNWQSKDQIFERKIRFTVFDSGYYRIPVLYGSGIPDSNGYAGNPLYLQVNYPADSLSILRPIKDIEQTDNPNRLLYLIVLGSLLLLGMLFVLWQFFRADKMRPIYFQPALEKKAWEKSLDALYELKEKKLWQQNKVKEYYDELNHILRSYLANGLKLPALESTTSEILDSISDSGLELEQFGELKQCLAQSDYVKFANAIPDFSANEQWMEFAFAFIRNNKELSERILEEKRMHWTALMGQKAASQFEFPFDNVPDVFIHTYSSTNVEQLELIQNLLIKHRFELPADWLKLHYRESGIFNKWHHSLLKISENKFVQVLLLLFVLPFISVFLPFLILMGIWKKEAIFSRGVFALSKNNKLMLIKEIK